MTSTWAGPKNLPRIYQSITVQAKAWKSGDLPPPAWESQKIHVANGKVLKFKLLLCFTGFTYLT